MRQPVNINSVPEVFAICQFGLVCKQSTVAVIPRGRLSRQVSSLDPKIGIIKGLGRTVEVIVILQCEAQQDIVQTKEPLFRPVR